MLIRAIDEALVLPSVAPGIGDNPGADLVLIDLSDFAVAIEVELYAVVVAADSKGMIEGFTPSLDILHTHHTGCLIGCRRRDSLPCAIGCHTDTGHTASVHGVVATMVI